MIPLREVAPERVTEAWNSNVPARYRLDAALVAQNLFDSELFHDDASLWDDGAFVAVKRSAAGLYDGPDPKVAHLSLFNGGSSRLLERAAAILHGESHDALVVGTDSRHFLPGAPTDVPWMAGFLKRAGFARGGLAFDLEHDLRGDKDLPTAAGEYRLLATDDIPTLDTFLQREFPGRWRYDVGGKVEREGPQTVFGLFLEGQCEGFALLQSEGCAFPIGGAVWKADLGSKSEPLSPPGERSRGEGSLGVRLVAVGGTPLTPSPSPPEGRGAPRVRWASLGPIGVAARLRGSGYGHALLGAALAELRNQGAARTIIDWTALVDFYGSYGFSVTRTYRSYRLDLAAGR